MGAVTSSGSRSRTRARASAADWAARARKIEDIGYSTLLIPDHFEDQLAPRFGGTAADVGLTPHLLIGNADQMAEHLQRRRELFGFSYIAISGDSFEAMAPVVKKLAGT